MVADEKSRSRGANGTSQSGTRWGQDRRLEFIDYRLRWAGHLNRADLTSFFGISIPQASLDVAEYSRRAPKNLSYDRRTRMYVAAEHFAPLFTATNESRYLDDLLRAASESQPHEESFLGWHPPVAAMPKPTRHVSGQMVWQIVHAIRDCSALTVLYQSFSQPTAYNRTVTPHALANDGWRWHIRAYCHTRKEFRDFLISRILTIEGVQDDRDRAQEDQKWHKLVRLVLSPDPRLSEAQRKAIELDYGMTGGVCALECRQALLFYVLRQLRLDQAPNDSPIVQQIVLQNRAELEPIWPKSEYR